MSKADIEWVAVDWGTSNLRVWLFDGAGNVVSHRSSGDGMGNLAQSEFEPALLSLISDNLPQGRITPVICCGMVGARQGWTEAPYQQVPCSPPGVAQAVGAPTTDRRLKVSVLPGISQAHPPDVMRGEETQVAGYLSMNTDFDGVICLPGTHTKWIRLRGGEIVNFCSFMTGELFSILSNHSVLRHEMADEGWDDGAFLAGVRDTLARPECMTAELFSIRAAGLLHKHSGPAARARLSGLLVGLELAGARSFWSGEQLVLIGSEALARLYETALTAQGANADCVNADAVTLAGLKAAYESTLRSGS